MLSTALALADQAQRLGLDGPTLDLGLLALAHALGAPSVAASLLFCIGLPIVGYGFVFKNWWILTVGVVWLLFGMTGWATEPSTEPGT